MNRSVIAAAAMVTALAGCGTPYADFIGMDPPLPKETWVYTGILLGDLGLASDAHLCRVNFEPANSDDCMRAAGYVRAYR